MKKIILTSVMALAFASSVFAQQTPTVSGSGGGSSNPTTTVTSVPVAKVPDKVPLASKASLEAYALTLVEDIRVQVWGRSVSDDNYRSAKYSYTDADPERMAYIASTQVLRFSAAIDDLLTSYVVYGSRAIEFPDPNSSTGFSQTSFPLFWGEKQFKLEAQKGDSWGVPADAYRIELNLDQVPWVVPGVRDAYIRTMDGTNQTGFYSLRENNSYWMNQGIIFLTTNMVSLNGELTLVMQNGSKFIYDLPIGGLKPTATVEAVGFRPTIKGIRTVPDNTTNIVYEVTDEIVRVAYPEETLATVSFPDGLGRYPIKVYIIDTTVLAADGPSAKWIEFNPYIKAVEFKAAANQAILIRFEYQTEPRPLNNNAPRSYGG